MSIQGLIIAAVVAAVMDWLFRQMKEQRKGRPTGGRAASSQGGTQEVNEAWRDWRQGRSSQPARQSAAPGRGQSTPAVAPARPTPAPPAPMRSDEVQRPVAAREEATLSWGSMDYESPEGVTLEYQEYEEDDDDLATGQIAAAAPIERRGGPIAGAWAALRSPAGAASGAATALVLAEILGRPRALSPLPTMIPHGRRGTGR